MPKLEQLSRREFLERGLRVGEAVLAAVFVPYEMIAQTSPVDIFRIKAPENLEFLLSIIPNATLHKYNPTPDEQRKYKEEIYKKHKVPADFLELVDSNQGLWFKSMVDRRYGAVLIEEAKRSIDHMITFLESEYLRKPRVTFGFAEKEDDFVAQNGDSIVIYLVAGLGKIRIASYRVKRTDTIADVKVVTSSAGEILVEVLSLPNFELASKNWPILYNAYSNLVQRVEAPAVEVLHKLVRRYGLMHVGERLRLNPQVNRDDLRLQYISREEKFVHALSILWLKRYNADRNLGLTEQELNKRFFQYENIEVYSGANQLAQHISKIGVQKAIELYVHKPDDLFRGAGLSIK